MANQTVTRTAETELEPSVIYTILADPYNIPKWAPLFADSVERTDATHLSLTKGGQTFRAEVRMHHSAFAADYIREMANNQRGGAYIRVMPRPLGGSTVVMTVPLGPTTTEADVAKTLNEELSSLIQLGHSRGQK